jgi:hypothetical protein
MDSQLCQTAPANLKEDMSLTELFKRCHVSLVHRLICSLLLLCLISFQFQVFFFILLLMVFIKFVL